MGRLNENKSEACVCNDFKYQKRNKMELDVSFSIGVGCEFRSITDAIKMIDRNQEFSNSDVNVRLILQDKECYETGKIKFQNPERKVRKITITSRNPKDPSAICGFSRFVVKDNCEVTFNKVILKYDGKNFFGSCSSNATLVMENMEIHVVTHRLPENISLGIKKRRKRTHKNSSLYYNNWYFRSLYEDIVDELKFSQLIKET